jgi:transcriptional regulator of heat shock response
MGELEDMGYIGKPHTSAGRVPTCMGYRYYVDNLLKLNSIPDRQRRFIHNESFNEDIDSIEAMLKNISHLLSVLTRYAGIACLSSLKFYMEGTSNMVDIPEFRDPYRMRSLLRLFDEKTEILKLLNDDLTTDGVKIHIGEEDKLEILKDLTLITSNFRIRGAKKGSLGVLGPLRMHYSTLIPLVDFLSREIEAVMNEMEIESE